MLTKIDRSLNSTKNVININLDLLNAIDNMLPLDYVLEQIYNENSDMIRIMFAPQFASSSKFILENIKVEEIKIEKNVALNDLYIFTEEVNNQFLFRINYKKNAIKKDDILDLIATFIQVIETLQKENS